MDYVILIGVVVVLALSALYGYKRGFVHIVLSMVAMLVTFILAGLLTVPVSAMIKSATPLYEHIEKSVGGLVADNNVDINSISNLGLPKNIEEKIMEGAGEAIDNFNVYLVDTLSDMLLKTLTFFGLIIVMYIIVRIIIVVCDFISKLPVLNSINKTGGLVVGLVQGLLIIWIACLVVTAFSDKAWAQEVFRQINDNALLTFIYDNNPIIYIVTKFI